MSKAFKWVLGILAVLVVIAVIAGGVWFLQSRMQMMASYRVNAPQPNAQVTPNAPNGQQNGPIGSRGFNGNRRNPFGGFGMRGPMMGGRLGRGMPFGMGFFFLGGLLRLIVPLGLLALVAILFYQLGKRAGRSRVSAPAPREPAPVETPRSDQDLPKTG
jgi:hypothetical protein